MQQNVQSEHNAQINNFSKDRISNPSKIEHSEKLHIINQQHKNSQQVINWQALYVDGKYYLADQNAYQKLKQIQQQIQKEKQLILKLQKQGQIENENSEDVLDKSYFSLNQPELKLKNNNSELDISFIPQNFDTKTEANISILQDRKDKAIVQLEKQEERYRENIRKAQLKRTEIKRKLLQDKEIPIKMMSFQELEDKKKKKQQNCIETSIKQNNEKQNSKNEDEGIIIVEQSQPLQHDQSNKIDIQKVSQKIINQSNDKLVESNQNQINKNEILQNQPLNKSIEQQNLQDHVKTPKSQHQEPSIKSHSKKYSVKKSEVIVPQSNETLQEILSKKQQKSIASRLSEQSSKISKVSEPNNYISQPLQEEQQIKKHSQNQQIYQKSRTLSHKSNHKQYTVKTVSKKSHIEPKVDQNMIEKSKVEIFMSLYEGQKTFNQFPQNQEKKSQKKSSVKSYSYKDSQKSEKIQLMYIPNAPKQVSQKSFKKTDKSIQWSEIDISNYGKTNFEQSRITSNQQLLQQVKQQSQKMSPNIIHMKKNKTPHIEEPIPNPILNDQKSLKSGQKSLKSGQKSFTIRSRQGSVKQKVQRYNKYHRQQSLDNKSLSNKLSIQNEQNLIKPSTNKAISYRSRKTQSSKNKNIIKKCDTKSLLNVNEKGQKQKSDLSQFVQYKNRSQQTNSQILVSKQQVLQLFNQIKLLQSKLHQIQTNQQKLLKQKQDLKSITQQQQANVQEILQQVQKQEKSIEKQQQPNQIVQIEDNKSQKSQQSQQNEQNKKNEENVGNDDNGEVKENKEDHIQENNESKEKEPSQANKQEKDLNSFMVQNNELETQFNEEKVKLLDEISRLKRIIRDLQIEKIKSIDHDKTILTQKQGQQDLESNEYGYIVHQNSLINKQQPSESKISGQGLNDSKSPYGRIVKNSPQKNRLVDNEGKSFTSDKKNPMFRINISKKNSTFSENIFANNQDEESPKNLGKHQFESAELTNQVKQSFSGQQKNIQIQQLPTLSPIKKRTSDFTKQEVLQKFNKTNREFQNFVQSSRVINETNSSISMVSQNNFMFGDRAQQSNRSIIDKNNKILEDEQNPEHNLMLSKGSSTHFAIEKSGESLNLQGSFTRIINNLKNEVEEQEELQIPVINISDIQTPILPNNPDISMNQQDLMQLAIQTFKIFDIIVSSEDYDFTMKKYKNCVILTKGIDTILWHYTGKFYMGGWKSKQNGQGEKTGDGLEIIPEKYIYKGQFLNGKKHGTGLMKSQNGNIYNGQWIDGVKSGQGTYYDAATKVIYKGQWKQGKKDGFGLLKFSNNEYYQGTFVKSIKQGYGVEIFVNGDKYKGEYKRGKFHGKGKYLWANGSSYDGDFCDGLREGNGSWKSIRQNGDIYVGTYKHDKKSGFGRYVWSNGCIYEGNFAQDVKHGRGKIIYSDGKEIKGVWQQGALLEAVAQNKLQKDQDLPLKKTMKFSFSKGNS